GPVPEPRAGVGSGGGPARRPRPRHGDQRPQPAAPAGGVVTAEAGSREPKARRRDDLLPRGSAARLDPAGTSLRSRAVARAAVVVSAVMWSLPTAGLLISSFRSANDINSTGWWTALLHPFETTWTLANYEQVLTASGMFDAFVNSLIVTVPAT